VITLYRKDIPGRGSLFYGKTLIFFLRGFRFWENSTIYQLEYLEVHTPEGTLRFHLQKRCLDFLWVLMEEEVSVESSFDYHKRLRHLEMGGSWSEYSDLDDFFHSISEGWVDKHLSDLSRYEITSKAKECLETLKELEEKRESPESRYAKTEKGKLTQKRYRESEDGHIKAHQRRLDRWAQEKEFKKAQKWMSEVVGRTYEDYLKLQIQQQEVKSDG